MFVARLDNICLLLISFKDLNALVYVNLVVYYCRSDESDKSYFIYLLLSECYRLEDFLRSRLCHMSY